MVEALLGIGKELIGDIKNHWIFNLVFKLGIILSMLFIVTPVFIKFNIGDIMFSFSKPILILFILFLGKNRFLKESPDCLLSRDGMVQLMILAFVLLINRVFFNFSAVNAELQAVSNTIIDTNYNLKNFLEIVIEPKNRAVYYYFYIIAYSYYAVAFVYNGYLAYTYGFSVKRCFEIFLLIGSLCFIFHWLATTDLLSFIIIRMFPEM